MKSKRSMALLPHRSLATIYKQGHHLGLNAPCFTKPFVKRYENSELIDSMIRRAYQQAMPKSAVHDLAKCLNRPRWWISKRTAALGLVAPRFKEPDWTEREIDLLTEHGHKSPEVMGAFSSALDSGVLQRPSF
jgi:hypothetical protein